MKWKELMGSNESDELMEKQVQLARRLLTARLRDVIFEIEQLGGSALDKSFAPLAVLEVVGIPLIGAADACLKHLGIERGLRTAALREIVLALVKDGVSTSDRHYAEDGTLLPGRGGIYDYH